MHYICIYVYYMYSNINIAYYYYINDINITSY